MSQVNIFGNTGSDRGAGSAKLDLPLDGDAAYINTILTTNASEEQFVCGEDFCATLAGANLSDIHALAIKDVDGVRYINFKDILLLQMDTVLAITTRLNNRSAEYERLLSSGAYPVSGSVKHYLAATFPRHLFDHLNHPLQVAAGLPAGVEGFSDIRVENGLILTPLLVLNIKLTSKIEIVTRARMTHAHSSN